MVIRSAVFLCLILIACRSRDLNTGGIARCLEKTDFPGHDAVLRGAIAWHIDYGRRVRETTCCALEPRDSVLRKRSDLAAFRDELFARIDTFEVAMKAERGNVRNDTCYGALMDLYYDTKPLPGKR